MNEKLITILIAILLALGGWNLHETWTMKTEVMKLQQGQIVLSKQIKKNTNLVKRNIKKQNKKQNNKNKKKLWMISVKIVTMNAIVIMSI